MTLFYVLTLFLCEPDEGILVRAIFYNIFHDHPSLKFDKCMLARKRERSRRVTCKKLARESNRRGCAFIVGGDACKDL